MTFGGLRKKNRLRDFAPMHDLLIGILPPTTLQFQHAVYIRGKN